MGNRKHWRHTTHNGKQHFIQNWTRLYPPESRRCLCYKLLTFDHSRLTWLLYGLLRPVIFVTCEEEPWARMTMMTMRRGWGWGRGWARWWWWWWWCWWCRWCDDADDAAAADEDDGVLMWWCGSRFKLSKGNNRSDRKAKVGSLEFLAFRVGMGLFLFTPNRTPCAGKWCLDQSGVWLKMFRGHANLTIDVCQAVHSKTAREILHTVPEVFQIVPEIFHIVPDDFHIVPEIFRIVPSQFLPFSDPRNGRDGFYSFYGSIFGHWRGMVDMWLYGATNWAGRALKRSRDTEAVRAWKTRFGICMVFGYRGARWFNSRGPPSLCCFLRVAPQSYTKNIDDACLAITGRNQLVGLFMSLMISIPSIFLKEFWVGCCGLYYTILAIPLKYGNYYIMWLRQCIYQNNL